MDKIAQISKWQRVLSKPGVCCIIKLSIIIYEIMEVLQILISVNTHGNWCICQVYPIQMDVGCFIPL